MSRLESNLADVTLRHAPPGNTIYFINLELFLILYSTNKQKHYILSINIDNKQKIC